MREATRSALGAEYDAAHAEGAALGDRAALALARRLTRPAAAAGGSEPAAAPGGTRGPAVAGGARGPAAVAGG